MQTVISLISDLSILLFDLALYMSLTLLKKDNKLTRGLMYGGVVVITILYIIAAYILHIPYSIASVVCMTIPSFLLFLCLSKYKTARFLVTFCFVDTVTFIIAAFSKFALILGGTAGAVISCVLQIVLCTVTFILVKPYCPKYRELVDQVSEGWAPMALSTVFIYILLIFSAAYPEPIIRRMEYLPVYVVLCVTILTFYGVFIVLILQKAKLSHANRLLQQQQHWHDLAYLDNLTQLGNSAAYKARTEVLEKGGPDTQDYGILIFDIDDFKHVNDTYGHHVGNEVLQKTARFFQSSFAKEHYEFFRVGGDEFAAIVKDLPEKKVREKVSEINHMAYHKDLGCTYSCGYAPVDFSQVQAFESAFIEADKAMYSVKTAKKAYRK